MSLRLVDILEKIGWDHLAHYRPINQRLLKLFGKSVDVVKEDAYSATEVDRCFSILGCKGVFVIVANGKREISDLSAIRRNCKPLKDSHYARGLHLPDMTILQPKENGFLDGLELILGYTAPRVFSKTANVHSNRGPSEIRAITLELIGEKMEKKGLLYQPK